MDAFACWQLLQNESVLYHSVRKDREESYWSKYAANYDQRRRSGSGYARELQVVLEFLDDSMNVLEIGAGTGAYTLAVAEKVASVTVIEPSPSMICILEKKLHQAGRTNVTIIQSRWEDADIDPHDVVLAAGCLYVFYDIRPALEKMVCNATRLVVLTTGVNQWSDIYTEAARVLNVGTPAAGPDFIHLYNALYQLGIHADVRMINSNSDLIFDNLDHAVDTWAERLRLQAEKRDSLQRFLVERLCVTPSGKLSLGEVAHLNAVVWFFTTGKNLSPVLQGEPAPFPLEGNL